MFRLYDSIFVRFFFFLALTFAVALSSNAKNSKSDTTRKKMRGIDLVGMKIYEAKDVEKLDAFGYSIKVKEDIEDVEDLLSSELTEDQEIISRIFELDEKSAFKNIYVFVAVDVNNGSEYALYIVYENKSGSLFSVDYDITKISENSLELENGPKDEIMKYKLETGKKLFGVGPI